MSVFYHGDTPPITAGQITPLGNHPLSRQPWAFELRYLSQYLVGIIIDKLGANAIAATIVMKQLERLRRRRPSLLLAKNKSEQTSPMFTFTKLCIGCYIRR